MSTITSLSTSTSRASSTTFLSSTTATSILIASPDITLSSPKFFEDAFDLVATLTRRPRTGSSSSIAAGKLEAILVGSPRPEPVSPAWSTYESFAPFPESPILAPTVPKPKPDSSSTKTSRPSDPTPAPAPASAPTRPNYKRASSTFSYTSFFTTASVTPPLSEEEDPDPEEDYFPVIPRHRPSLFERQAEERALIARMRSPWCRMWAKLSGNEVQVDAWIKKRWSEPIEGEED